MAQAPCNRVLMTYTIYHNPRDYPGKFVVREFLVFPGNSVPGKVLGVAETLKEARLLVPYGLCNMGRETSDQPQIVETWL
jgi:hypothetical protein